MAIKDFRHKGLERFFATGTRAGIQAKHAERLRLILGRLNAAASSRDMALPGLDLHELRGAEGHMGRHGQRQLARHVQDRRQGHGAS